MSAAQCSGHRCCPCARYCPPTEPCNAGGFNGAKCELPKGHDGAHRSTRASEQFEQDCVRELQMHQRVVECYRADRIARKELWEAKRAQSAAPSDAGRHRIRVAYAGVTLSQEAIDAAERALAELMEPGGAGIK